MSDTTLRTYDFFSTTHDHRSRSKETIRRCNTESKFSDMMKLPWRVINDVGKCKKRDVGETWEGQKISAEYKKTLTRFESYSGEWRGNTLPLMAPFKLKAEERRLI